MDVLNSTARSVLRVTANPKGLTVYDTAYSGDEAADEGGDRGMILPGISHRSSFGSIPMSDAETEERWE